MSRHHLERTLSLVIILGLVGVIVWRERPEASVTEKEVKITDSPTLLPSSSPDPARTVISPTHPVSDSTSGREALEEAEDRIRELERQLAELARPLETDVRSATVNTTVENDETLITGGYQTPDSLTHFLFLTPEKYQLEDGRIGVRLQGVQLALTPEQLGRSELIDLTSNAGNTLQHGQAWKNDEVAQVMDEMEKDDSGSRLSAPNVFTMPGMRVDVSVGEEFSYSITPDFLEDDSGFHLQMRMEHVPAADDVDPSK